MHSRTKTTFSKFLLRKHTEGISISQVKKEVSFLAGKHTVVSFKSLW